MKKWTAAALAALTALTALTLTGCSFQDVMLYLYGGDSFVTSAEPDYSGRLPGLLRNHWFPG